MENNNLNYIIIGLCVYNNEFGLPRVLENIKKMNVLFERIQIIAFYDKSQDKSLQILQSFENDNIMIDIIINENEKSRSRTENISQARNNIIETIKKKYLDKCEYFIMMDSNEYSCIGDINIDVLKYVFNRRDEWDAISFDREAGYYDTWALSFDPYIYSFFHFENSKYVVEQMRKEFNNILNDYKNNKPDTFINVYSAFNGFAIYKTSMFINCTYSSKIKFDLFPKDIIKKQIELTKNKLVNYFNDDCEHRAFHLEAIKKNNASIRICTKSLFSKINIPNYISRGPA